MSQFEYGDFNKFLVSIGLFLIGLTFLLPWLFFRENFDLLIKSDDLKAYTETAQHILTQRQSIVSYFPTAILIISSITLIFGAICCYKGISGWVKADKLKQEANQLSNRIATEEVKLVTPESTASDDEEIVDENVQSILIPINNLWDLNHWGSNVAHIKNGKMIFEGTKTRLDTDGCNISLKDVLQVGKFYKVSCFAKSAPDTTGEFQLWCHDNIGIDPHGFGKAMPYAVPPLEGVSCSLKFEAKFNSNIRIHLQYKPGNGRIEVSDVRITPL
jgi:hypothetical protein